jgi:hypothetical protein
MFCRDHPAAAALDYVRETARRTFRTRRDANWGLYQRRVECRYPARLKPSISFLLRSTTMRAMHPRHYVEVSTKQAATHHGLLAKHLF